MCPSLNLLMVEDNEDDVILLKHTLKKAGYELKTIVVDTAEAMKQALEGEQKWDVITSDHSMPRFSAPEALAIAKKLRPDIPFIILSGEINLNLAVSLMRDGAQDYIQKNEMVRIVPAIERELSEVELRKDRQLVGRALAESDSRFREVLENSQDAAFKRNFRTNEYEYLSPVFTEITGYAARELTEIMNKKENPLAHPNDAERIQKFFDEVVANKEKKAHQIEFRLQHKDGHYLWVLYKFSVVNGEDGLPLFLFGSISDISERKKAEEELISEHRRLELVIESTSVGTWEWNVQTGETVFNECWANILGRKLDDLQPVSIETWKQLCHPEDLGKANEALTQHFSGNTDSYDCEFRMQHQDGHWVWIHDRGRVITWTEDGRPLMMYGMHEDISDRVKH